MRQHHPLRLFCVLAHSDDESMATGSVLAKYRAEGVETYLITATRGEVGWFGVPDAYPGPTPLGKIREAELRAAAQVLGLHEVVFLDYIDGQLDQADAPTVIGQIAHQIRRIRPDVVVTFGQDGLYGRRHLRQFTTAAVLAAADARVIGLDYPPHRVAKLYYRAPCPETMAAYQAAFGDLVMHVDGQERQSPGWTSWTITTRVDTTDHWRQVWEAVRAHRSQLPCYEALLALPEEHHRFIWGEQEYYRVFSLVNGGRLAERDLFEGLRTAATPVQVGPVQEAAGAVQAA
jgi:LmbE family N-acetylglucosaminyl deacetylase